MNREQAAQYLGISPRTLYRLEQGGKLTSRKEKTPKGHVVLYEVADLDRLKVELASRAQSAKTSKPPRLKRVTFGLSPHDFEELAGEAKKYGMKPGEYARKLMRESLESRLGGEIRDLHAEDAKTAQEVKRLRNDVAGAFEALLEFLKLSPEEASQWVTENIR